MDCQLADWTSRGLDNSRTGQVADSTTRGCQQRLCVLSFRFLVIRETASCPVRELSSPRVDQSARCPVRELAIRELANPRVVQLPCVYGHIRIPDMMVTTYRFITHTFYKCRRCTNFVRVSQTQFRKRQLCERKQIKTEEYLKRNAYRLMNVLSM